MNEVKHVAIIMDGNGRWATKQNKKRVKGHEEGAKVVRKLTIHASNINLSYLTLYAFSTENWKRPKHEVEFLMNLLDNYLKKELPTYLGHNVKFNVIGDISKFSKKLQERIEKTKEATQHCTGLTQTLAINYGSQDEIARAVNKLCQEKKSNVTIEDIQSHLDTKDMPEVDIMIRTGGQKRLSNFLLWQNAYSELFFTDTLWPDFTIDEYDIIINDFKKIHRRFGAL